MSDDLKLRPFELVVGEDIEIYIDGEKYKMKITNAFGTQRETIEIRAMNHKGMDKITHVTIKKAI